MQPKIIAIIVTINPHHTTQPDECLLVVSLLPIP
jgi:hypothetical protein